MCGYLCQWGVSVLEPKGVLFHSLTHSRGNDLHTLFALTDTDKTTKAMMMHIWAKWVLSSDLALEVASYV